MRTMVNTDLMASPGTPAIFAVLARDVTLYESSASAIKIMKRIH